MDKIIELAKQAGFGTAYYENIAQVWGGPTETGKLKQFYTLACAELSDKVASLEAELLEQCRINGVGAERELKLMEENARLQQQAVQLKYVHAFGEAMCNVQLVTDLADLEAEHAKLKAEIEELKNGIR